MEEQKLNINIPSDVAEGTYANLAIISHSASEFILDFVRMVPGVTVANVKSRVIITPDQAKKLMLALQDNVKKYEKQYGVIQTSGNPTPGTTIPMSFGGGQA